ncbi:MAG: diiron oxygenase [Myxococcales bacterium]|nr:diiron oxygenase [Myxococcales bacterium]
MQLAFSTVAEVTINAYLDLLADDRTIQPLNREITALHRKDESSHSKLFKEFTRALYPRLSTDEQAVYLRGLTAGLDAFVKLDLSAWAAILRHLEVPGADGIIADCERSSAPSAWCATSRGYARCCATSTSRKRNWRSASRKRPSAARRGDAAVHPSVTCESLCEPTFFPARGRSARAWARSCSTAPTPAPAAAPPTAAAWSPANHPRAAAASGNPRTCPRTGPAA